MRLQEGERTSELEARPAAEGMVEVRVGGRSVALQVEEARPGCFVVRGSSRREILHCVRDGSLIHVFWRGVAHRLREEREGARGPDRVAAGGLAAPMPGKVIAVRVQVGQEVAKGQEMLVVEAMKMENALRAPRAGRVKSVQVAIGDMVSPGAVLVELE